MSTAMADVRAVLWEYRVILAFWVMMIVATLLNFDWPED